MCQVAPSVEKGKNFSRNVIEMLCAQGEEEEEAVDNLGMFAFHV